MCLNIDASKVGKTLSDEELAKMDESDKFGDIVGIGRNLGAYKGWNKEFQKYLLQPVDKNDNEWFYPVTSLTQGVFGSNSIQRFRHGLSSNAF
ncbi:hypothetical protein O7L65_000906 [Campylobacter jejuni]|nr:hypothetical protein [Campylobacter jejuni]